MCMCTQVVRCCSFCPLRGVTWHSDGWHAPFIRLTWLIYMCDMPRVHVRHDSFVSVMGLIHMRNMTRSHVWHDSSMCVPWIVQVCEWHTSNICAPHIRIYAPHIRLTHTNDSRHPHKRVISHTCLQHITYMDMPCHTYEWFTCVTWFNHMCTAYMPRGHRAAKTLAPMTYSDVWHDSSTCVTWLIHTAYTPRGHRAARYPGAHDSFMCVTWLIRVCDITYSHVWQTHPYHTYASRPSRSMTPRRPWLIHMCDTTHSHVQHDSSTCLTWLIHMCDMTHSHVQHDSSTCFTWLIHIHMCDMTHSYVWHDSLIHVTWLIEMCDTTHWYMWHDSSTCFTWPSHTAYNLKTIALQDTSQTTWPIHMCNMTHIHVHVAQTSMAHSYV